MPVVRCPRRGTVELEWFRLPLYPYYRSSEMLAKLTSKNQLTLPKAIISAFPGVDYFDVTGERGRIVLTPVRLTRADAVRNRLAELGLSENDVADAVAWARRTG